MGWFSKGSGKGGVSKSAKAMSSIARSQSSARAARSKPAKGSAWSTKGGKGPGRYSGKKK